LSSSLPLILIAFLKAAKKLCSGILQPEAVAEGADDEGELDEIRARLAKVRS